MLRKEQIIERCAMVAHEVNRVYSESIGEGKTVSWDFSPDWQKDSVINGVKAVLMDPNWTPKRSHENWVKYKEAEGWVYGEKKDPEAKTHPCLVSYSNLPEEQKTKDRLFIAAVRSTYEALTEATS